MASISTPKPTQLLNEIVTLHRECEKNEDAFLTISKKHTNLLYNVKNPLRPS